ncbi:hypothetical protein BT93_G1824 [Corymbia citriodora subsp. variegata]|nr:hypothetical protein BT93_G1824 [Corymbia citriodora subsp. variegata]
MNKKDEVFHPYRLHCFCYDVLKDATNKFSGNNFIGEGGFGDVYKGWISYRTMNAAKPNKGLPIAVKRLRDKGPQGQDEWLNELRFLSKLNHPNIVKLVGYCSMEKHRIVVYEFMAKGSLEDQLLREKRHALSWRTRIKIAIGAARGLDHLHSQSKPVIHRDVKTSNFLLTAHFDAKISDFGLAKFGPQDGQSHVSTRILGTRGYFAPEYITTGHLTLKTDVYSFGVVLLEIFKGSRAIRKHTNGAAGNLAQWAEPYLTDKVKLRHVMDRKLKTNFPAQEAHQFAEIILSCLQLDPKSRPTMAERKSRARATMTSQATASLGNLEAASNSKDVFRKPEEEAEAAEEAAAARDEHVRVNFALCFCGSISSQIRPRFESSDRSPRLRKYTREKLSRE